MSKQYFRLLSKNVCIEENESSVEKNELLKLFGNVEKFDLDQNDPNVIIYCNFKETKLYIATLKRRMTFHILKASSCAPESIISLREDNSYIKASVIKKWSKETCNNSSTNSAKNQISSWLKERKSSKHPPKKNESQHSHNWKWTHLLT